MEKCELKVTPIYKSGDKDDPNNYRPISVLRVNFKSNNNNNNNDNNHNHNNNNNDDDDDDLEIAHPKVVLRLPYSWSYWNLEMLVFEERGKLEYLEKNLSEQTREPTTNTTHIWRRRRDLNPGHIGGRPHYEPQRSGS